MINAFYFYIYLCNNKNINYKKAGDFMTAEIDKLTKILKESNNIVFFGGAGMSTDSSNKVHNSTLIPFIRDITTYILL